MGKCQQTWLDPDTFITRACGVETERREGDRFVCEVCLARRIGIDRAMAEKMTCPRCGSPLALVPATEMHPAHQPHERARKCTKGGCPYICYMGDEGPRPVVPVTPGLPPRKED